MSTTNNTEINCAPELGMRQWMILERYGRVVSQHKSEQAALVEFGKRGYHNSDYRIVSFDPIEITKIT